MDKEEVEACEKLVHDQHLQQQGWAAVVANLEDITRSVLSAKETYRYLKTQLVVCLNTD